MAVAAYASVLSLMHVLDNIQLPAWRHRLSLDTNLIRNLQENVYFLQDFLEIYSQRTSQETEDLVKQITVVADEAEDLIDLHVVDQLRCRSDEDLSSFCDDVDRVIQKIDSIKEELMRVKERWADFDEQPMVSVPASSLAPPPNGENTLVGFDEHLVEVMDQLTTHEPSLQVIPIVGMGGIGKTTLARNVFDHPYIVSHFDTRIWFTISQQYSVKEILLGLLRTEKNQEYSMKEILLTEESDTNLAILGEKLYKRLFGKRYLIVMDDVWSTEAWDDFRLYLPNNSNGSRVVATTRLSNVAIALGSRKPYLMNFLDEEKSWNLLCEKVFGREGCPYPELEEIGKVIAKGCRGLPLAMVAIGGLLAKSKMTVKYWEFVAQNINSFANSEDDESCLKILSLSYNNLPLHLKPCFLYMRVFPEDHDVKVSELIKLWVGEGFLRPVRSKSLEEVAQDYLEDLVGRNLILISERKLSQKMSKCRIHDLLRDLCLRESHKEYFLHVPKVQCFNLSPRRKNCFLCGDEPTKGRIDLLEVFLGSLSMSVTSPLVCEACKLKILYPQLMRSRSVRVTDMASEEIMQPTRLRHLFAKAYKGLDFEFASPSPMHLLWNLQTLLIHASLIRGPIVLPPEIWALPQLRHLVAPSRVVLPDPIVTEIERKDSTILVHLQTLTVVQNFRCMQNILERIPNLKILKIFYIGVSQLDWSCYALHNLAHLHNMESLFISAPYFSLENITFPYSLKKLTLSECRIPWKDTTIIGLLPNLNVLKLSFDAFQGPEWNPIEGEFLQLKALRISYCGLVRWRAEDIHFPNLATLELKYLDSLEEIPSGIGDISTLHSIHLDHCSDIIIQSARQILEEQEKLGNNSLQVHVTKKYGERYPLSLS